MYMHPIVHKMQYGNGNIILETQGDLPNMTQNLILNAKLNPNLNQLQN